MKKLNKIELIQLGIEFIKSNYHESEENFALVDQLAESCVLGT